eukprot:g4375.t1
MLSAWQGWGPCSKSCTAGSKTRQRTVATQADYGGAECDPVLYENAPCNEGDCPIHCVTSAFSAWATCTKSCGTGQQSRSRSVIVSDQHEGYVCPYLEETRDCNEHPCADDCAQADWGAWGACTKSCGNGSRTRERATTAPSAGGKTCAHSAETQACNTHGCPVDCKLGSWASFSACSRSCGDSGYKSKARSQLWGAQHGGASCSSDVSRVETCNIF